MQTGQNRPLRPSRSGDTNPRPGTTPAGFRDSLMTGNVSARPCVGGPAGLVWTLSSP
jgi:hypothetical protein